MLKALKAILIFATMIAIPIAADNFLHKRPDLPLSEETGGIFVFAILLFFAIFALALGVRRFWAWRKRLDDIESYLKRAERDMNSHLSNALAHGGRKDKAKERAEWHRMAESAAIQTFNAGYRTPAHDLIELNEKDLASKGSAMGKACNTAFLFRELYEGSVESAQAKIVADVKNGGSVPYVAPGISQLIGFDKFHKDKGFPEGAGVDSDELHWVAKWRKFPSEELLMVTIAAGGAKSAVYGQDVLINLTQQRPPEE